MIEAHGSNFDKSLCSKYSSIFAGALISVSWKSISHFFGFVTP